MNDFYSIAQENQEPKDDFQLRNLGRQFPMLTVGTMNKLLSTMLFVLLALVTTFGQDELFGKYTLTDNPGSYLILHADRAFKMSLKTFHE
jgi:hypothetical protein